MNANVSRKHTLLLLRRVRAASQQGILYEMFANA
jgi:hypothetical protein